MLTDSPFSAASSTPSLEKSVQVPLAATRISYRLIGSNDDAVDVAAAAVDGWKDLR